MHSERDAAFMARALELAAHGRGFTSPNPMVGAVIVASDGRIIGEGWHRQYGGPHAEVNAVRSVAPADEHEISEATIYVTLEPCSHYGKTPPCAKMLVDKGFRRVVVGSGDPNPKVAGRGIEMLRSAGIEVTEGVLEKECDELNVKFMTAHRRGYPWVTLKWACSADGYLDGRFSGPLGRQLVHQRRAEADVIVVGAGTVLADRPRLDVRDIAGTSPRPVVLDRHNLLAGSDIPLMKKPETLHITDGRSLRQLLEDLYRSYGYISVLVEGGAKVLQEFIDAGLWDEAFVEVSSESISGAVAAPTLPVAPAMCTKIGLNKLLKFEPPLERQAEG